MSLSRESPFRHKVVYSIDNGCLLRQNRSTTSEKIPCCSRILMVNGRLFLRCSIVWWQICWIDYWALFEELMSENKINVLLLWENVDVSLNCTKNLLIKYLVTKLRTNQNVHQVLLYVCSTEKWTGMKTTGLKCQRKIKFMSKSDFHTIRKLKL